MRKLLLVLVILAVLLTPALVIIDTALAEHHYHGGRGGGVVVYGYYGMPRTYWAPTTYRAVPRAWRVLGEFPPSIEQLQTVYAPYYVYCPYFRVGVPYYSGHCPGGWMLVAR
jgi:hypothetical protein